MTCSKLQISGGLNPLRIVLRFAVVSVVLVSLAPSLAQAQFPIYRPTQSAEVLQNGFTRVVATDSLLICGLDEGLGFVEISGDSEEVQSFTLVSFYHEDQAIVDLKLFDSVLVAYFGEGLFKYYDVTGPPEIKFLGQIRYDNEFLDFTYHSGAMYFAEEFKGITKYNLLSFGSIEFADSTMVPIRTTQLELRGDTLYALDDYNGILRITDLGSGLGSQLNYLWLPFQAIQMTLGDSDVVLSQGSDGFQVASIDGIGFTGPFTEHASFSYAHRVLETDSNFIIISSPNKIEVISKADPGDVRFIDVIGNTLGASLVSLDTIQALVTPSNGRGLTGFAMNVADYPKEFAVYDHPGPIRLLEFNSGSVYSGGGGNPLEVHLTNRGGLDLLGERSYPPDISAGTMDDNILYLVDNSAGFALLWLIRTTANWLPTPLSSHVIPINVDKISVYPTNALAGKNFLLRAGSKYYLNQSRAGEAFGNETRLLPLGIGVSVARVTHSRIYYYSTKGRLAWGSFNSVGSYTEQWSMPFSERINEILPVIGSPYIALFSRGAVSMLDMRIPALPKIAGRYEVEGNYHAARMADGLIFAGGPNSVGILSAIDGVVFESAFLPVDANQVAAGNGSFYTSNGSSIRRFDFLSTDVGDDGIDLALPDDFLLSAAYPNPFNATVNLAFSGVIRSESDVRVEVYNVLGQLVRELPISEESIASGLVQWDGKNSQGVTVASGMYLAKLQGFDKESGRVLKLILLK